MANGNQCLYRKYQPYFPIGTCVDPKALQTHKDLIIQHYNSLTAENHMKFALIHPRHEYYDFSAADQIAAFANDYDKLVRGHTLVWHNQTPDWVFQDLTGQPIDKAALLKRMEEHIHTVVSRYRKHIYCWDVVNEAVEDKEDTNAVLRDSHWLRIIGPEFIEKAFEYAHAADANALLFYNDYNACTPHKRDKIYNLVKNLKDKGVPIHGIGLQGHWNIYWPSIDEIRAAIEKYASLEVELHITELDLSVFKFDDVRTDLKEPTNEMMELQAKRYEDIFKLFREYSDVLTSVTFWGAADDQTWLHDFPVRGRTNWPLLFDMKHNPKQAFNSVINF